MNSLKKDLLLTFDYELFLGSASGSVDSCMIDPTNRIMEHIDKHNLKAIFFVDTTCLLKLSEYSQNYDACYSSLEKVKTQLKTLNKNGHSVFPHIHPHWIDAKYDPNKNEWSLVDVSKYRFNNLSPNDREMVFDSSIKVLNDILYDADGKKNINGYRAGGWSIQPFKDFKPFFIKHGIKFDFSVQSQFYQFTDAQHFDFSDAPLKPIYNFTDDVTSEDSDGIFTEFSINNIYIPKYINKINKTFLKIYYKLTGDHTFNYGHGHASTDTSEHTPRSSRGYNMSDSDYERIAIELMTPIKQSLYRNFIKQNGFMHFISHPKMINKQNIKCFSSFLDYANSRYNIESDFMKMLPNK